MIFLTFFKVRPLTFGKGMGVSLSPTSSNIFFSSTERSATAFSTEKLVLSDDVRVTLLAILYSTYLIVERGWLFMRKKKENPACFIGVRLELFLNAI